MTEMWSAGTLSAFLSAAGAATLAAALVLAVVVLADLALARRVSARVRAALYLAVFVRLALPAQWASPLGMISRGSHATERATPVETVTTTSVATAPASVASVAPARREVPAGFAIWAGVASLLALGWLAARSRTSSLLAGASEPRERVRELAGSLPVVEHPTRGPAVFGLLRPRIVIPSALADRLTDDALRAVIAHEAMHLRRRDPLRLALMQLAVFAAWPVVPAWIAAWRVRGLMEQACDEAVLENAGASERRAYGEALLAVAQWQPMPARLALGMLSFGGGLAPRLRAMRRMRRWPRGLQAALGIVVAVLAVLGSGRAVRAEADSAGGVPPLVIVDMGAAVGVSELPAGATVLATVPWHETQYLIATGRTADLRATVNEDARGPGMRAWLGGWEFQNIRLDQFRAGARVVYRMAPRIEDDGLVLTIGFPEPERRFTEVPVTLHEGESALIFDKGTVAVLLTPRNVAWSEGDVVVSSPRITLDVHDAKLGDVLEEIEKQAGGSVQAEADTDAKITFAAADQPVEQAIEALARTAGLQPRMVKGFVKLVGLDAVEPELDARIRGVIPSAFRVVSLRKADGDVLVRVRGPAKSSPDLIHALETVGKPGEINVAPVGDAATALEGSADFLVRLTPPPAQPVIETTAEVWRVPDSEAVRMLAEAGAGAATPSAGGALTASLSPRQADALTSLLKDAEMRKLANLVSSPKIVQYVGQAASLSSGFADGDKLELALTPALSGDAITLEGELTSVAGGRSAKASFSPLLAPGVVVASEPGGSSLLVLLRARRQ